MKKTYKGSCHCSRNRFWPAVIKPAAFRLLAGQGEMTKYLFNTKRNEHYFCKHCGVRCFGIGNAPDVNRAIGVNLGCLEDAKPEELAAAPIIYVDGKNDQWHRAPAITTYL